MMTIKIPRDLHTAVKVEAAKVHMSIETFVAAHLQNAVQNAQAIRKNNGTENRNPDA